MRLARHHWSACALKKELSPSGMLVSSRVAGNRGRTAKEGAEKLEVAYFEAVKRVEGV